MALTPDIIEKALSAQQHTNELIARALGEATVGVAPYDDLDSASTRGIRAANRLERAILALLITIKDAEITKDTQIKAELQTQLNSKPAN